MNWCCSICGSSQSPNATFCSLCLFAKPMDRKRIPQIFAGYSIHFNGVIPQTLTHPSHAVEWRMAERHGAVCMVDFNKDVNILVYRPGYERSDKCRRCVESGKCMAVTIRWMLDSLLETRQIHPSIYQLTFIPEVANPTPKGINLPHYQHPFFLLKAQEYGIPTSFPPTTLDYLEMNSRDAAGSAVPSSLKGNDVSSSLAGGSAPPFFEMLPVSQSVVDVYRSALDTLKGKKKAEEPIAERKDRNGVEIISSEQHRSRVDTMLFSGVVVVLSSALCDNSPLREVLSLCGAKVMLCGSKPFPALQGEATHVLYHHDDKKSEFLIYAAQIKETIRPGLLLCESTWIEDCLLLGEMVPPYGMYGPSAKLMETLKKKYEKMTTLGKA